MSDKPPTLQTLRPGPLLDGIFRARKSNPAAQDGIMGAVARFHVYGDAARPQGVTPEDWQAVCEELAAADRKNAATSRARAAAGRKSGAARRLLRDAPPSAPPVSRTVSAPPSNAAPPAALLPLAAGDAPPPADPSRAKLKREFRDLPEWAEIRGEMYRDPVAFACDICGVYGEQDRNTFGAKLKELGKAAFLDECETFRAELKDGESVRNRAAALTARLKKRLDPG